jgi:hypothetical protein
LPFFFTRKRSGNWKPPFRNTKMGEKPHSPKPALSNNTKTPKKFYTLKYGHERPRSKPQILAINSLTTMPLLCKTWKEIHGLQEEHHDEQGQEKG